jgi:GntR family transcriptional regulator, transcriptional repressor for pyruvate dehydrogenase complex
MLASYRPTEDSMSVEGGQAGRTQLRQPRLAEMIASVLRQRILSGALGDGELPSQDKLLEEFRVSRPSLREALRILESEGLITVRRGNVGGAQVHLPKAAQAAYALAMILESKRVELDDVGTALKHLEPLCAGLCAARGDRRRTVVPQLKWIQREAYDAIDDELRLTQLTSDFHRSLVTLCGVETLSLIVGAIESIWLAHVGSWAESVAATGGFPDVEVRRDSLQEHDRIIELIEAGDSAGVEQLAREHFDPARFYRDRRDARLPIRASFTR